MATKKEIEETEEVMIDLMKAQRAVQASREAYQAAVVARSRIVYDAYTKGVTLATLSAALKVRRTAVYKDIDKARREKGLPPLMGTKPKEETESD